MYELPLPAEMEDKNMNHQVNINTKYKDRLFRMLFGSYERKDNIISLYNALNNSSYNADDITELTTLDDAVYIKMKNDVSLLIDSYLPLWEQQSSYNPNMPIRGLMYFGNLYEAYIDKNNKNIYGTTLIKLPTPQYVVFYNGTADQKPLQKLKLSDAFIHPDPGWEFEWTATMYNLNKGKNDNLLHRCRPLSDYMTLVNYIRDNQKSGMPAQKAIDEAVKRCIKENVLKDFLKKHRAEVMDVCLTEYNEEVFVNGIREDGRIEGHQEGLKAGRAESTARLNHLNAILIEQKRYDDLERSTKDAQFQNQLLEELVPEAKQEKSVPVWS
jgi:hypothetical protein